MPAASSAPTATSASNFEPYSTTATKPRNGMGTPAR